MSKIEDKVKAAFTLDRQEILKSFQREKTDGFEPYNKCRIEAREVYESLLESGAIQEADKIKEVAEECLGSIYPPNETDTWGLWDGFEEP